MSSNLIITAPPDVIVPVRQVRSSITLPACGQWVERGQLTVTRGTDDTMWLRIRGVEGEKKFPPSPLSTFCATSESRRVWVHLTTIELDETASIKERLTELTDITSSIPSSTHLILSYGQQYDFFGTAGDLDAFLTRIGSISSEIIFKELEERRQLLEKAASVPVKITLEKQVGVLRYVLFDEPCNVDSIGVLACSGCGEETLEMKTCGRCKIVKYCSTDCQKRHWPEHKSRCVMLADRLKETTRMTKNTMRGFLERLHNLREESDTFKRLTPSVDMT